MHARTREPGGTWRVWRTQLLSSRIHASLLQGSPNFQQDLYFPASTAAGCGHCIWPMRCSKILTAPQDHPEKTTGRTHTHFFGLCSELVCVTGGPSWYVMKELGPDTSWIRGTYWLGLLTAGFLHERNKLGSCLSHCHFRSVIRTKSNPNEHSRDLFVCLLAATSHSSARTSSLLFLRLWWTVSHRVPPFSPTGWAGSQTIPARIPSPCAREGNLSGVAPSGRWV